MLANVGEETLTVPKHTVLGIAQQVSEELIDKINAESESDSDRPLTRKKNETLYKKLLPGKLDHLTNEDRRHIEPILASFYRSLVPIFAEIAKPLTSLTQKE